MKHTGLIVNFTDEVSYYKSQRPTPIKEVTGQNSKAYKSFEGSVTVKNKFIEVTLHADGNVEMKPHAQLLD